jgi:hypothetical protein
MAPYCVQRAIYHVAMRVGACVCEVGFRLGTCVTSVICVCMYCIVCQLSKKKKGGAGREVFIMHVLA